ncbi:methylamine utilization protein MauJ [Mesorhizobium sp.]|uniref:methylamine utilization protein MauJ n=1 Tax=Mesorhizobium sp. TaxID=1871066 RepID=UPI0026006A66|nr:methylamine utilization protein MauJ [Mesorhizobium sp.]
MRDEMGLPLPIERLPKKAVYEAVPELLKRGQWICLNIEPSCAWPTRPQTVEFGGYTLWIIPLTQEDHPGVAINRPPDMSQEDAESLLYRFLSVVAWRHGAGIAVPYRTGGGMPYMMALDKKSGFAIREPFDFTELICPEEEEPRIALALVREARSLNHHGYAFLSYWRVLELAFPKAADRVSWMNATLPTLKGTGVQEAKDSIAAEGAEDTCAHLFASGRCAIAHATGKPVINPDDPRDASRLYRELPLVREMAIRAVEERFGIATPMTEYQQHLYELRGWKKVLGEPLLAAVTTGTEPKADQVVDLPPIHVRLRTSPPYGPFEGMVPKGIEQQGRELLMVYGTEDGLVEIRFRLAPAEERLKFDIFDGIYGRDDGSVAAAEYKQETQRFFRDYMLNGELQMWNADSGALLSRLDAYVPLNMMVDLEACNANIAAAREEVERRRAESVCPG